jgi:hypothetical protein
VRSKFFRWLVPAILLAVLFTCDPAHAQTRIAHTSQGFRGFQYAVINNAGEVCFSAIKINGTDIARQLYRSDTASFPPRFYRAVIDL